MRLIDADALSHEMYVKAFIEDSNMQRWDGGCWIRYKMFERAIKNAPTISSKTGHIIDPIPYGYCSVCGFLMDARDNWNYCPNCGARMVTE